MEENQENGEDGKNSDYNNHSIHHVNKSALSTQENPAVDEMNFTLNMKHITYVFLVAATINPNGSESKVNRV